MSKTKAVNKTKAMDKNGLQMATSSPGTASKKLNIKPMELMDISKIKQEPNTEFDNCKTDSEFKENIGESSSNLLDSTSGFSKLHDTLNLKSSDLKSSHLNDVFHPHCPIGTIQVVNGLEKKQAETRNQVPAVPLSFGKISILEGRISSESSRNEMEGTIRNVLCSGKEVFMSSDPVPGTNRDCSVKKGKTNGDRGRTMNRNCRQVDQVTSAK